MNNSTSHKNCRACGLSKGLDSFYADAKAKDGRRSECKECKSVRARAAYEKNVDAERAAANKRYAANPEPTKARVREHRGKNPDLVRAYNLQYRAANGDKLRAGEKAWREANKERHRESSRKWSAANPERAKEINRRWREANADQVSERLLRRRALMVSGNYDEGISAASLRARHGDMCAYCDGLMVFEKASVYLPLSATVEHVIPLARGGEHTWSNTILACRRCNSSKSDRLLEEWGGYAGNGKNGGATIHQAIEGAYS